MRRNLTLPFLAAILVFATILSAACSTAGSQSSREDGLRVVATTTQIGDFARNVGGEHIHLTVLLSPNQDAHDFELEPSQIRAVAGADVVLRNGLGLDAFLDKALDDSHATVATLTDGLQTLEGGHTHEDHEDEEEHDEDHDHDPHVWHSVSNARHMVEHLRDALAEADPANAGAYRENAEAYFRRLDALDAEIRAAVESVPLQCRKLVTAHGVLGYYASEYGFDMVGTVLPGTSSESQASAGGVAQTVAQIKAEGVPAIFAEASINPNLAHQVGREAGVPVIEGIYGDSLGSSDSDGATYIEMMRANTHKITAALQTCEASHP